MSGRNNLKEEETLRKLADKLSFPVEHLDVLRLAVTHSTYFEGNRHENKEGVTDDNQRLEFLGDAVLSLVVGAYLYQRYPQAREGELSKMRAYLVCEASLAEAASTLGLEKTLRMGKGAEAGGERFRPSIQADAYEAMIGAVFLTQGYHKCEVLILGQFGERIDKLSPDDYEDKKSMLQEIVQAKTPHGVIYRVLAQSGPDHKPRFESGVYCGKLQLGVGTGGSKKESEIAAAATALINREQWLDKIEQ